MGLPGIAMAVALMLGCDVSLPGFGRGRKARTPKPIDVTPGPPTYDVQSYHEQNRGKAKKKPRSKRKRK
jgi:hypothetical protein